MSKRFSIKKFEVLIASFILLMILFVIVISVVALNSKKTYDMSDVSFSDETFEYDGNSHSIEIEGSLPDGVSVTYTNDNQTEIGVYEVVASFEGDSSYNSIDDMCAKLIIEE